MRWCLVAILALSRVAVHLSHPCLTVAPEGHLLCYEPTTTSLNTLSSELRSYYKSTDTLEHNLSTALPENVREARGACYFAVNQTLSMTLLGQDGKNQQVPLVIFKPLACQAYGNMIGQFFELVARSVSHGFIVVRAGFPPHEAAECGGGNSVVSILPTAQFILYNSTKGLFSLARQNLSIDAIKAFAEVLHPR